LSKKIAKILKTAKGVKLVDVKAHEENSPLTNRRDRPFRLCFKYKLENDYRFDNFQLIDIKKFQAFLDKIALMVFREVDTLFLRHTDKNDEYHGQQVIHYEVAEKFRIHGIIENGEFVVIRLDPNHRYHE